MPEHPRVAVLTLGGTIAMTRDTLLQLGLAAGIAPPEIDAPFDRFL